MVLLYFPLAVTVFLSSLPSFFSLNTSEIKQPTYYSKGSCYGSVVIQTKNRKRNTVWSKIKPSQKTFLQEWYLVTTTKLYFFLSSQAQATLVKKTHAYISLHSAIILASPSVINAFHER